MMNMTVLDWFRPSCGVTIIRPIFVVLRHSDLLHQIDYGLLFL
jgi:hypothetical protein